MRDEFKLRPKTRNCYYEKKFKIGVTHFRLQQMPITSTPPFLNHPFYFSGIDASLPPASPAAATPNALAISTQSNHIDIKETLQEIYNQLHSRGNLLDKDYSHISREELLTAKGLISENADIIIDALLSDGNYDVLAVSVAEGWLSDTHGWLDLFGSPSLSLEDMRAPSSASVLRLEKTIAAGNFQKAEGVNTQFTQLFEQSNEEIARSLIKICGSANQDDANAVVPELTKFPREVLLALKTNNIHIAVCRNSIGEYVNSNTSDDKPRGWISGSKIGDLPGLYDPNNKEVIIATVDMNGKRAIPLQGKSHGSIDMLKHESLHAYQYITDDFRTAEFKLAREKDLSSITDNYLKQNGDAGLEESYAELGAAFLDGVSIPHNLNNYFSSRFLWEKYSEDK